MGLKIENVKNFKITEIPENPECVFFDFVDTNNQLTRIEVHLKTRRPVAEEALVMDDRWTKLVRSRDLHLADTFKRLVQYPELHPGK